MRGGGGSVAYTPPGFSVFIELKTFHFQVTWSTLASSLIRIYVITVFIIQLVEDAKGQVPMTVN